MSDVVGIAVVVGALVGSFFLVRHLTWDLDEVGEARFDSKNKGDR